MLWRFLARLGSGKLVIQERLSPMLEQKVLEALLIGAGSVYLSNYSCYARKFTKFLRRLNKKFHKQVIFVNCFSGFVE